jgi:hypothetical protein
VLEELRDDAAVKWAYPALRNLDTGTLLLLTPRIIVGVDPKVADHEVAALLPDTLRVRELLPFDSQIVIELTTPGHGTSVAGVAAAAGDNGLGVSGACQNCKLLSARVFSATGAASDSAFAAAIAYAGAHADVLNNSGGGGSPSTAITSAIQNAVANGRGGLGSPTLFSNGNSASGYIHFTLSGLTAGTWTFTWTYHKDGSTSAGFDTAWLDNVIFPDGTVEDFEGCSGLPSGWTSSGDANWTAVNDETRASSRRGGNCSIRAGVITDNQTSTVEATQSLASGGALRFEMWPSSERVGTTGPIVINPPSCYDYIDLTVTDSLMNTYGPFFASCGTWSNQGNPLRDGFLSSPSSVSEAIS